ncbi:telomere-associated protein RIF1 isoform X2 [Ambystoma mexicanum]|uniref:telomere-associated protein RIF1 isoform X2 n=1 Tax=Ambystoma mexicanum TaxID=8296 RepID=UPI0037E76323
MTRTEDANLQPLLETLEDGSASVVERTDAYLAMANRLSGEEGKEFTAVVGRQFPRVCKLFKKHMTSENSDLSNAALQALGFCVFNSKIASEISVPEIQELLTTLNSIATTCSDKNTCTRALWVIAKQSFPSEEVRKMVPNILSTLETVLNRGDVQSMVIEYEALNIVIRLLEQTPASMGEEASRWAKLVIPLVVHSAPRVRLRGATALEMGMPLLLQKQQDVAAITEPLMSTKIISELQRLFSTKNETYVLKLWPLFVKLLGKTLHRSGSFINSLLQLEELGFRSGSPVIKKIAFIAWKSLIDNFASNPEILSSTKRLKLLMQPLCSIHVRTEALALTKLEVWWYLLMRLGPQLSANFEQVCAPLIQNALSVDSSTAVAVTPARGAANQSLNQLTPGMKSGTHPFASPTTPRMNLNSSSLSSTALPSVQLLGLEMLLHFLLGPEIVMFAKQNNLMLGLEPLQHPLITSPSFFCKHASTLLNAVQDGFIAVGKDASDAILQVIWKDMISLVKAAIESSNKRDRQGSDVLPLLLQALKNIVIAEALPPQKALTLIESTIKGLPQKALGSAAYQVANMDLLHGTPALFLIQLLFHNGILEQCAIEERFFICLETLVSCVLSGPTSPLAFSESVLGVLGQRAKLLENKEHLWRMWSIIVNPLTEKINQTNEVNQGDALEHNFSAMHSALTLPVCHLYPVQGFPQPTMKSLLRTWSDLYRAFARCAALVATTEENVCCEELCLKILAGIGEETVANFSTLDGIVQSLQVIAECINFSPYSTKYPPKTKAPQTPTDWAKKKREPLGNLTSFLKLLVKLIDSFHALASKDSTPEIPTSALVSAGSSILGIITSTISHIAMASIIRKLLAYVLKPLAVFYERTSKSSDVPKVYSSLSSKTEKLLSEILLCLQSRYSGVYDSELLDEISPLLCAMFVHKNKQIRNQTTQFWNATFAKAAVLLYPEALKPVLSQVKQKTPLLLPGFESVEVVEDSSGPYSDAQNENSQLDTKISGIEVKSSGKRDSMLAQAEELKDKGTPTRPKQAKLKLEFSSPKIKPNEKFLEEDKSMDFVFIPPETKERVLTEHQKEVLRTKRVDIPTMYNNLDASQDTTLFAQYTQSQDDIVQHPPGTAKSAPEKQTSAGESVHEEEMDTDLLHGNQAARCSSEEKLLNESISKERPEEVSAGENTSTGSIGSDVVSDTPPLPSSRRQSFITLEKFDGPVNKPFSPPSNKFPMTEMVSFLGDKATSAEVQPMHGEKRKVDFESKDRAACFEAKHSLQKSAMLEIDKSKQCEILASKDVTEDSMDTSTIAGSKSNDELMQVEEAECIPDTQDLEPHMKSEARDNAAEADIDFKENQPPRGSNLSLKINSEALQNTPSILKSLRRSSRRRLDISEFGNADQEKLDRIGNDKNAGDENPVEAGPQHDLPKHTVVAELDGKVNGEHSENEICEKIVLSNLNRKEQFPEEVHKSSMESLNEAKNGMGDPQDTVSDKGVQEKSVQRSKYQTRRASLVSLHSTENSESDSSETKEEIIKKKRTAKGRPKNIGMLDVKNDSECALQELPAPQSVVDGLLVSLKSELVSSAETDNEITSTKTFEFKDTSEANCSAVDLTGLKDSNSMVQEQGAYKVSCTDMHISEPSLQTVTSNKTSDVQSKSEVVSKMECFMTEPTIGDFSTVTPDVFSSSAISTPQFDCPHKRSKRLRKSKGCDCCTGQQQEKTLNASNISEKEDLKPGDQNMKSRTTSVSAESSSPNTQFEDSVFVGPSAVSTPMIGNKKPRFFKVSRDEKSSVDSEEEKTILPQVMNSEDTKAALICITNKSTVSALKQLDDQRCDPFSAEEMLSDEPLEHCSTSLPTDHDPVVPVKKENVMTNGPGDIVHEVDVGQLVPERDQNKKICNRRPKKSSHPTSSKISCASTEMQFGPVIMRKVGHVESAREDNATLEEQPIEEMSASAELSVVDTVVSGEQALNGNVLVNSEEKVVLDIAASREHHVVDIAASGEHPVEEVTACGEHAAVDGVAPGGHAVVDGAAPGGHAVVDGAAPGGHAVVDGAAPGGHAVVDGAVSGGPAIVDVAASGEHAVVDMDIVGSPLKLKGFECAALTSLNGSPSEVQARCIWSPSASPSTSILKKGVKRQQEDESPSPVNKLRRVSFADPIYKEEMADDIDRRSPVVRCLSSSASSPTARTLKISNVQCKLITTPTKGFISPGSRSLGPKSSKKCLITEMAKESLPSPKESVYPALVNCTTPVDVILPQITSNMWARGLGQLIRAKNIKTVGDLSTLTATEIKTLPIRSPKISTVKKALRVFHEQQMKSRGFDEFVALEEADKQINGLDDKTSPIEDDHLAQDLLDQANSLSDAKLPTDLMSQLDVLALRLTPEELSHYSGSSLFEMQEKLSAMSNCVMRNLQTRWTSPPHESSS